MCGRYALALRAAQIRFLLQEDNMPVDEAPDDEGEGAPRPSYNFAPGYHGIVYRADVPDWGAGPRREAKAKGAAGKRSEKGEAGATTTATPAESTAEASDAANPANSLDPEQEHDVDDDTGASGGHDDGAVHYKLQTMKWGLIPFWTKRNPDYGSMLKTINCRDDSLAQGAGGMWNTMKARKRCIVVAQGFYEWLKKDGSKDKVPHFIKRKDGALMCCAGLWDCVQYENEDSKLYTYTIITTDSNKQLRFLHDRMPVILDNGSEALRTWLDPKRHEWSRELQSLLKPFDGELEVYPVSKDVGKVGNNSPTFIVPLDSKENKSNIANFFAKGAAAAAKKKQPEVEVKMETGFIEEGSRESDVSREQIEKDVHESLSKLGGGGVKREADAIKKEEGEGDDELPKKMVKLSPSSSAGPVKPSSPPKKGVRSKVSATSNGTKSPQKSKSAGTQKITKFFGNSA